MRAYVDAKTFSDALNQVCKVIQPFTLPALDGILIQISDGYCSLTGTDFTTWLTVKLPVWGENFAFVLWSPQAAAKACRYFEGELMLELHETKSDKPTLVLSCGKRSGEFDAIPTKDYPAFPQKKNAASFTTNAAALLKRIERVKYAVRRPNGFAEPAQCTCVQFSGNDVFCVDGYRVACDTDTSLSFPRQFLTWGKSLSFLKLMGNQEAAVEVDDHHIWFSTDDVAVCCRREGAEAFNLWAAVPKNFQEEFYVSPKVFLRELEYLDGFQPKKKRFTVYFWRGRMFIDKTETRCSTSVPIEGESSIPVGFDSQFMKDALNQFKGEERVRIKFSGESTPIIVEADGRNDFAMVLPVRPRSAAA